MNGVQATSGLTEEGFDLHVLAKAEGAVRRGPQEQETHMAEDFIITVNLEGGAASNMTPQRTADLYENNGVEGSRAFLGFLVPSSQKLNRQISVALYQVTLLLVNLGAEANLVCPSSLQSIAMPAGQAMP
ncbi:MAG: hypothetical protein FRX49_13355 [Trebouxia sp. A1-2]|nr:MAG: hypothetical protein FRX49_13355 [Trebouxia sp. A1-2]